MDGDEFLLLAVEVGGLLSGTGMNRGAGHATFLLFPIIYIKFHGGSWRMAVGLGVTVLAVLLGIFDTLIQIVWPEVVVEMLLGID